MAKFNIIFLLSWYSFWKQVQFLKEAEEVVDVDVVVEEEEVEVVSYITIVD